MKTIKTKKMNENLNKNSDDNNYQSNCCDAAIIWNYSSKSETGLCTKCKEWATVVKVDNTWYEA